MARWPKPPEGSWTEHFQLGTEPISYEDSIVGSPGTELEFAL